MKIASFSDFRRALARYLDQSQSEPVIITRHGQPVAYLVGCQSYDLEDVWAMLDPAFRKIIEQRRSRRSDRASTKLDNLEDELAMTTKRPPSKTRGRKGR